MFVADEYYEGKRAFREGWGHDECPYPLGSSEHTDWTDGWEDAEGESELS